MRCERCGAKTPCAVCRGEVMAVTAGGREGSFVDSQGIVRPWAIIDDPEKAESEESRSEALRRLKRSWYRDEIPGGQASIGRRFPWEVLVPPAPARQFRRWPSALAYWLRCHLRRLWPFKREGRKG